MTTAYDFDFTAIDGSPLPLRRFEGHALLVVNVASKCGFTPQYAGLQKLHEDYAGRGLTVIGVPSNQFGGQEPAREMEIASFCQLNYGVSFPMTAKTDVVGGGAHPFYRWIRKEMGLAARPLWNFHKLLVGREGAPAGAFASVIDPGGATLRRAVESALDGTKRSV